MKWQTESRQIADGSGSILDKIYMLSVSISNGKRLTGTENLPKCIDITKSTEQNPSCPGSSSPTPCSPFRECYDWRCALVVIGGIGRSFYQTRLGVWSG